MISLFEETKDLIHAVDRAIYFFQQQNYFKAYASANRIIRLLQNYLERLPENVAQEFFPILELTLAAMEERDGIKLSDIWAEGLLPLLYQIQQSLFEEADEILEDCWGKNRRILKKRFPEIYREVLECRENIPDKYQISWAKTGDLTLEIATEKNGIVRMNSMNNPWQEAMVFAGNSQSSKVKLVIGFGMGYHLEFLQRQPLCKKIVVLEHDINALAIALSYRDLTHVLSDERIQIVHPVAREECSAYLNDRRDDMKVCVWYPSVRAIEDDALREELEDYKVMLSSIENMGEILNDNFITNVEKRDLEVSCLKDSFKGKKVILVAAGPSLDDNMELLKKAKDIGAVIVCVGKVAKKLIFAGIEPDYIVMTDGQQKTVKRIEGIEDSNVPLIYLSTVASEVVENYHGKRYIAFQSGLPIAEDYAKENDYPLYQSGGSVATFALDLLIRFACAQIVCVGLDMGYFGERTHAAGVGHDIADKEKLRKVEGVASEFVYSSKTLDIYRTWIEDRIKNVKVVELINASKGARIHGMKEIDLKDYLS